jgi:hypothetical protein
MIAHGPSNLLLDVNAGACCSDDVSSRTKKTDYLMLDALQSLDINNTGYFVGTEHPIHCRFEELNGDAPVIFRQM